MLCKNCGEYFNSDAKFCPVCGTQLSIEEKEQNITVSAEKTVEGQPNAAAPSVPLQGAQKNSGNVNNFNNMPPNNMPPNGPYMGVRMPVPPNNGFSPSGPGNMPPSGGKDNVNKILITLICVLGMLIIIGTAVFFYFYNMKNNDEQPNETTSTTMAEETSQPTDYSANTISVVTQPTTVPDNKVKVPNVTGIKFEDAVKYLEAAGLEYEFELVADDKVQANYVISQSPEADSSVEKGSKVMIKVSKPSEPTTQSATDSGNTYYVIASEYVTLRDAASRSGREITKVNRGEKVTYISSDGEFYYVSYNGNKGYILAEFLSKNKDDINSGSGNASLKNGDICIAAPAITLHFAAAHQEALRLWQQ